MYRQVHNMSEGEGTIAHSIADGEMIFGVNSRGSGYTDADWDAAAKMRARMIERYPGIMKTDNLGQRPNDALFHAEATLLLRASRGQEGSLADKNLTITTDRALCPSCVKVLPHLGMELGNPSVTFNTPLGSRTMHGGTWLPKR